MKTKICVNVLALFITSFSFAQYSNYYTLDVSSKSTVNQNINVSGNINKTVSTIDYGALANANAIREKTRLERLMYTNEREKQAVLAIAENPERAFDYGVDNNWKLTTKDKKITGLDKRYTYYHKIPHASLFVSTGGYNYENISEEGITTQIILYTPTSIDILKENERMHSLIKLGIEESLKYSELKVGEVQDLGGTSEAFLHKKDINRANVNGSQGFIGTLIWEDDYEICITDNYMSKRDGIIFYAKVRFKGDKDEITFEQLEGRRYYFNRLIKKMISSAGLR